MPDCLSDCRSFSDRSVQTNRGSRTTWYRQNNGLQRVLTVEVFLQSLTIETTLEDNCTVPAHDALQLILALQFALEVL